MGFTVTSKKQLAITYLLTCRQNQVFQESFLHKFVGPKASRIIQRQQSNTKDDDGELLSVVTITSALQEFPSLPSLSESEANSAVDIQPAILSETEQGTIECLAGYVAHRLHANPPNLQSGEQRGTMASMSWVKYLS